MNANDFLTIKKVLFTGALIEAAMPKPETELDEFSRLDTEASMFQVGDTKSIG